jgi:hypothetical protein
LTEDRRQVVNKDIFSVENIIKEEDPNNEAMEFPKLDSNKSAISCNLSYFNPIILDATPRLPKQDFI